MDRSAVDAMCHSHGIADEDSTDRALRPHGERGGAQHLRARQCADRHAGHQLLAFRGADGYPVTVPIQVKEGGPGGIRLTAA